MKEQSGKSTTDFLELCSFNLRLPPRPGSFPPPTGTLGLLVTAGEEREVNRQSETKSRESAGAGPRGPEKDPGPASRPTVGSYTLPPRSHLRQSRPEQRLGATVVSLLVPRTFGPTKSEETTVGAPSNLCSGGEIRGESERQLDQRSDYKL